MTFASDHSTAGAVIGGSLKKAGFGAGIVRYACAGRSDVNITPHEVQDLRANGIPIAIVLEHQADWLLGDAATVRSRVSGSRDVTRACNLPDGVVYMAADFDATEGGSTTPGSHGDRNMRGILSSLSVAADVIGRDNVGFYGSAYAIDWLVRMAPWIRYYWDTEAWSHGRPPHPAACLYQRAAFANVGGVSIDVDVILKPDWGQRGHSAPAPKPAPAPKRASGVFAAELSYDHDAATVTVSPRPGKGVQWGDVSERIRLEVDVEVGGRNPKRGRWTGKVIGTEAP